jgi:hypothetical protein
MPKKLTQSQRAKLWRNVLQGLLHEPNPANGSLYILPRTAPDLEAHDANPEAPTRPGGDPCPRR